MRKRGGGPEYEYLWFLLLLKLTILLIDTENDTESIFIKISLHNNKSLIVGSIYRPPNSDINYVEKIKSTVDNVLRKNRTSVVWIGGDINLPDICWKTQSIIGHQNTLRINSTVLDLVQDNHLEQVVTFPSRKEHALDLFLTNRPSLVNRCESLPGLDIVYIDSNITGA